MAMINPGGRMLPAKQRQQRLGVKFTSGAKTPGNFGQLATKLAKTGQTMQTGPNRNVQNVNLGNAAPPSAASNVASTVANLRGNTGGKAMPTGAQAAALAAARAQGVKYGQ